MHLASKKIIDANTELNGLFQHEEINSELREIRFQYEVSEWVGNIPFIFLVIAIILFCVSSNTIKLILTVLLLTHCIIILTTIGLLGIQLFVAYPLVKGLTVYIHECEDINQLVFLIIVSIVYFVLIIIVKGYKRPDIVAINKNLTKRLKILYFCDSIENHYDWKTIAYIVDERVKDKKEMNKKLLQILSLTSLVTIIINQITKRSSSVLNFGLLIVLAIAIAKICLSVFSDNSGLFMWKTFAEDVHQVTGIYSVKSDPKEDK